MSQERGRGRLKRYLNNQQMTANSFAIQNGLDPSVVYKVLRGENNVSLQLAAKIEEATDGFVDMKIWV